MYVRSWCGYCARARAILAAHGVEPEEYDVTFDALRRAEMIARSGGRTTVPQIFVDGQHLGGCDDLEALEQAGDLGRWLERP